jgi:hypothetical protein
MDGVDIEQGAPFHAPLPLPSLASSTPQPSHSDSDGDSDSDAASTTAPDRGMSISPRQSEPSVTSAGHDGPAKQAQPGVIGGL